MGAKAKNAYVWPLRAAQITRDLLPPFFVLRTQAAGVEWSRR